ncbi:PGPGW domain-containing protein [Candidatus Spongiihabitans sp.]|uniref:PGPGW domain-containing protein n=1 Tax=Candidatus Spongiihabitans sp. TaxID=3101308 RepID=UPI003C7B8459
MPVLPRQILGVLLLMGGLFWFLPMLGLWMIPLGLLILSIDFQWARRGYLSIISWLRKWRDRRKRNKAD